MTVGAFVAYLELFSPLRQPGSRIPQLANSIQSGAAAYARLRPLLAPALTVEGEPRLASFRPDTSRESPEAPAEPGPRSPARLGGVTRPDLSLPRRRGPALRHLDLEIPAGALVGSPGPSAPERVRSRGRSSDFTPSSPAPCSSTAARRQSSRPTNERGSSAICPRRAAVLGFAQGKSHLDCRG